MIKQRRNVVAILDLGSTKISCLIVKISSTSDHEILGEGFHASVGIRSGIITDLQAATNSITNAIEAAEKMAELRINKVYVSINSNNLLSHIIGVETSVVGHEINSKDINRLIFQALDKYKDQNVELIHSFTIDYILDGNRGIVSPLGMYGNILGSNLHIISCPINILANLSNCLTKCQLEVESYVSSSYAAGLACLTEDEMKYGVTLIDFGGGCTSISVFNNGQLIYTDGVMMGGMNVTNDIARGLNIAFDKAERIKNIHGTLIFTTDSKDEIELPPDESGETEYLAKSMLVEIIKSRVEEILEILTIKLRESGHESYANRIVITGGGSALNGMQELVSSTFSAKVRVGFPINVQEFPEVIKKNLCASQIVGMVMHIVSSKPELSEDKNGSRGNILQWIKDFILN